MAKYTKVDPERLELVERCCICGRLFFKTNPHQYACNLWPRPGKPQSACVWMRAYTTRLRNKRNYYKETKKKKNKKITGRPRHTYHPPVKTPSGCKITQNGGGRCKGWGTCSHRSECSNIIPEHWKGFTSVNGCKGYEMAETMISQTNPNYDYDTVWEIGI